MPGRHQSLLLETIGKKFVDELLSQLQETSAKYWDSDNVMLISHLDCQVLLHVVEVECLDCSVVVYLLLLLLCILRMLLFHSTEPFDNLDFLENSLMWR